MSMPALTFGHGGAAGVLAVTGPFTCFIPATSTGSCLKQLLLHTPLGVVAVTEERDVG
jgi:hypothetical protein